MSARNMKNAHWFHYKNHQHIHLIAAMTFQNLHSHGDRSHLFVSVYLSHYHEMNNETNVQLVNKFDVSIEMSIHIWIQNNTQ